MADIAALNILIGANIDEFERAMSQAERGIGRLGQGLKSAGSGLTAALTLPLGILGGAALAASAQIDALRRGLQAVTQQQLGEQGITGVKGIAQAAEDTKARLLELRQVAALPGLGFAEAIQGDIRLRAVGISADLSKRALLAFGNAIATTGGGKGELDRVTVQLGQLSAKGKVLAQDLRPIIEAAPAVATALKTLYGTVDSETISKSLAKQGKSSTDFISILTDELGKLPKVTGGLKNAFENLSDSGTIGLAKLGDALNKAFNIEGKLGQLGDFITGLADKFEALDPATQKVIFALAGVAAAAGPLLFALGSIGVAVPAITAGFAVLGVTSAAALLPVLGIAAGVAAAAVLVYQNWERISPLFTDIGLTLSGLGASFEATFDVIGRALDSIGINSGNLSGVFTTLGGVLVDLLIAPLRILAGALDVVVGSTRTIIALYTGDLTTAATGASQVLDGLKLAFLGVHKEVANSDFSTFFNLKAPLEEISGLMGGNLAGALGTVTKLTKEQQDALDKLRQSLRDNENASRALGDKYDFIGGKSKILESGIKSLTDVGFAPAGRTVQGFVGQLNGIPEAVDRAVARVVAGLEKMNETPAFKLGTVAAVPLPTQLKLLPIDTSAAATSLTEFDILYAAFTESLAFSTSELTAGLTAGFSGIGAAIGEGLFSGADIIQAAGDALLKALGDLAVKKGNLLIADGVASLFIPGLQALGAAQIAAGIGLVAAGSFVGASGSSSGASGSGGGGGGGGGGGPAPTRFTPTVAPAAVAQGSGTVTHNVVFNLQGNNLLAAINIETDRLGRVTGRKR